MALIISPNDYIKSYGESDKFIINPKFIAKAWEEAYSKLGAQLAEIEEGSLLLVIGLPSSGKTSYINSHMDELEDYDVIFDGGFPSKISRSAVTNIAIGAGWEVDALYIDTPYNVCRNRNHRNANSQRIPFEAFKQMTKAFSAPKNYEGFRDITVAKGYTVKSAA